MFFIPMKPSKSFWFKCSMHHHIGLHQTSTKQSIIDFKCSKKSFRCSSILSQAMQSDAIGSLVICIIVLNNVNAVNIVDARKRFASISLLQIMLVMKYFNCQKSKKRKKTQIKTEMSMHLCDNVWGTFYSVRKQKRTR